MPTPPRGNFAGFRTWVGHLTLSLGASNFDLKMPPYSSATQRAYIIGLAATQNAATIARRPEVTVSVETVRKWIKRYREGGFDDLKTRPKPGRRKATNAQQDEQIVREVLATPLRPAITTVRNVLPNLEVLSLIHI